VQERPGGVHAQVGCIVSALLHILTHAAPPRAALTRPVRSIWDRRPAVQYTMAVAVCSASVLSSAARCRAVRAIAAYGAVQCGACGAG
jgi:hypothetical protein